MKVVLITTDENTVGIGVRSLSSCLIAQGFETAIIFMTTSKEHYKGFNWTDLKKLCCDAGLIGISCMTHGVEKAIEVKQALSKLNIPIIIGGIHATLAPESIIDEFNLLCRGEGDDVIVDLAAHLKWKKPIDNIPGIWLKNGNQIVRNQSQPLKKDLNSYPFPDYDLSHHFILELDRLVPMKAVPPYIWFNNFVVMGSRGCPHNCTYCSNHGIKKEFPWLNKVRHYTVKYLIDHLKEVCTRFPDLQDFWIQDDTFLAKSLNEISEFCKRYKTEVGKPIFIMISPNTFSEEKIALLIDAGMNRLIMGVQSGSENITSQMYGRAISNKRILEIAKLLNKHTRVDICYDFIVMNPFECEDDLINTINFIRNLPTPFFIFCNKLAFYPGTQLYEWALNQRFDLRHRNKHSDEYIGYLILIKENIKHKIFHLLLILMGGKVNDYRIGKVPRFLVSDKSILLYRFLNEKLTYVTNKIVTFISVFLLCMQWKRIFGRVLNPHVLFTLKSIRNSLRDKKLCIK
jgi:anaerobic magnesium-protoporphyrin IX monomethyl ester cyclase